MPLDNTEFDAFLARGDGFIISYKIFIEKFKGELSNFRIKKEYNLGGKKINISAIDLIYLYIRKELEKIGINEEFLKIYLSDFTNKYIHTKEPFKYLLESYIAQVLLKKEVNIYIIGNEVDVFLVNEFLKLKILSGKISYISISLNKIISKIFNGDYTQTKDHLINLSDKELSIIEETTFNKESIDKYLSLKEGTTLAEIYKEIIDDNYKSITLEKKDGEFELVRKKIVYDEKDIKLIDIKKRHPFSHTEIDCFAGDNVLINVETKKKLKKDKK